MVDRSGTEAGRDKCSKEGHLLKKISARDEERERL